MQKLSNCEMYWVCVGIGIFILAVLIFVVKPAIQKFMLWCKLNRWKKAPRGKVECEQGGDFAIGLIGGGMEAGVESECEVVLEEEIEVDSILSCKNDPLQLYKIHEPQFRAIFPEEIWALILDHLQTDPDSQKNCANASPYFWELLKKERVVFLFPDMLQFLAPYTTKRKFSINVEIEENVFAEEEENDFWIDQDTELWRSTILNCRLVCSGWNTAVEQFYSNAFMAGIPELSKHSMDPRSFKNRVGSSWTSNLFRLAGNPRVHNFLWKFEQSHFSGIVAPPKNPIFGRSLVLSLSMHYLEELKTGLLKILRGCGKDIWYCCMSLGFLLPTTGNGCTSEIVKVLGLMPNLRYLKIFSTGTVGNLSKLDFQANQFPRLEKLQMLEFDETGRIIVSEMLRVNNHVKVLKLRSISSGMDLEVKRTLTNLRDFPSHYSNTKLGLLVLEGFGHNCKQLEKLYLERGSDYFGMMGINWGNTLTELDLKHPFGLDEFTILKESRVMRLNLPRIRKLSLFMAGLFYLDFIQPMENSLEHLRIQRDERRQWTVEENVKKWERIELVGFERKMHKSNIWELFGKLKTIEMRWGWAKEFLMFSKEGKKYKCIFE